MSDEPTQTAIVETAILLLAARETLTSNSAEDMVAWARRFKEGVDTDPLWANGAHHGDCTKRPTTCLRCLWEVVCAEALWLWAHDVSEAREYHEALMKIAQHRRMGTHEESLAEVLRIAREAL